MKKDKKLIPPGIYCYVIDKRKKKTFSTDGSLNTVFCPYSKYKEINNVKIPWCYYLDRGGLPNPLTDEDFNKLVEYFGSDENVFDFLSLDLLWDDCKECGERDYYVTEEKILNWIKIVENERI